jgi:hypothetical protein
MTQNQKENKQKNEAKMGAVMSNSHKRMSEIFEEIKNVEHFGPDIENKGEP